MRAQIVLVLVGCGGLWACSGWPKNPEHFAEKFVKVARRGTLPPEVMDEPMLERLRRVQLLKRVDPARVTAKTLETLWRNTGEEQLSVEERGRLHREHAVQALRSALWGECHARLDPEERKARLAFLTSPVPNAPADAAEELRRLARELEPAVVVQVTCERGGLGILALPLNGWRVADLYELGPAPAVQVVPTALHP